MSVTFSISEMFSSLVGRITWRSFFRFLPSMLWKDHPSLLDTRTGFRSVALSTFDPSSVPQQTAGRCIPCYAGTPSPWCQILDRVSSSELPPHGDPSDILLFCARFAVMVYDTCETRFEAWVICRPSHVAQAPWAQWRERSGLSTRCNCCK